MIQYKELPSHIFLSILFPFKHEFKQNLIYFQVSLSHLLPPPSQDAAENKSWYQHFCISMNERRQKFLSYDGYIAVCGFCGYNPFRLPDKMDLNVGHFNPLEIKRLKESSKKCFDRTYTCY